MASRVFRKKSANPGYPVQPGFVNRNEKTLHHIANSEILLFYQTEDGQTKIDVRLEDETVWLSQVQMAELFQTTKQNISLHIKNIFEEGELLEDSTVKDYLTVQTEGKREVQRNLKIYNLLFKKSRMQLAAGVDRPSALLARQS